MEFGLIVILGLAALVGAFLLLGKYYPGTGADVLDWQPARSYEDEARLELEDIDQMLEAQNERRRRTGRAEITEDGIRAEVQAEEAELRDRAARFESERERGEG